MTNLIAVAFIAIALTSVFPGLLSSWTYPGFAIGVTASGYTFRIGWLIIATIFLVAGIGLWRRREWSRQILLGACLFLLFAIILVVAKGIGPFLAFGFLAWAKSDGEKWWFLVVGLTVLVAIILLFLTFRYLRSPKVADLFARPREDPVSPRRAPGQPLLVAVLLTVLAYPLNREVNWWASEMPKFMRTPAMDQGVAARRANDDARLGMNWQFSDDERTIVLQSVDAETAFVVLDVETGKVTRKPSALYAAAWNNHPDEAPWHSLSPDAKRFVNAKLEVVSLADDRRRELSALPRTWGLTRVGFADAVRFLVHERAGGKGLVKLIDVETDRAVYSVELAHDYDLRWGVWSPDRKNFAWAGHKTDRSGYDQPRELNVLDVAGGIVDTIMAPCEIKRVEGFSRDGELLYLSCKAEYWRGPCASTNTSGGSLGLLYDTKQRNFTVLDDLPYGKVLFASGKDDRMVYWTVCSDGSIVSAHSSRLFGQPRWALPIGKRSPTVTADGKLLVALHGKPDSEPTLQFASLSDATDNSLPSFQDASLILRDAKRIGSSPSGALLLALASPAVEIIRADTLGRPQPTSIAVDLSSGRRIERAR